MTKLIQPDNEFTYDGTTIRAYKANVGEGLPKHQHEYAHATICFYGSLIIRKEGIEKILRLGDAPINLRENEWHEIEALEDGTMFANVFAEGKY